MRFYIKLILFLCLSASVYAAEKSPMININATLFLQIINFAILLYILVKLLWGPLTKFLDERTQKIKSQLEKAEKLEKEASKKLEEYNRKLEEAKKEILQMRDRAEESIAQLREEKLKEAHEEAQKLIENARKEIEIEIRKVKKELQEEAARLSVLIARKFLEKEVSEEDHKKLLEEFLKNGN